MLVTEDEHVLEAELAPADDPRGAMVLCHPHPTYGGTMRSIVIGALFAALPAAGVTCLRFNFRGCRGQRAAPTTRGAASGSTSRAAIDALAEQAGADSRRWS